MKPIYFLRIASAAFAVALVALIVASSMQESLIDGLRHVWSRRWGITTLVDLYAGLFVVAAWMFAVEGNARRAAPWIAGLLVVGNLATVVYVLSRSLRCSSVREAMLGNGAAISLRAGARPRRRK